MTHFHFKQEHAKRLCESLTYYLCTHEENQLIMPEIRQIVEQHGIQLDNYAARVKKAQQKLTDYMRKEGNASMRDPSLILYFVHYWKRALIYKYVKRRIFCGVVAERPSNSGGPA
nr:uncharacterized protein LOC117835599 [Setaria viridis]